MTRFTLALAIAIALPACKKEDKQAPAADPAAKPAETDLGRAAPAAPAAPAGDGPFAAWDMTGRKAAFQGAFVTPGSSLGAWEAWEVKGDQLTSWDGTAEKKLTLNVKSPCEVDQVETSGGGSMTVTSHYTIKDGQLIKGLGDAGSRKGPEAVACVSNKVFTVDAKGACLEWEESMFDKGKYESKPGTCGFKQDGGKEVFAATANGMETKLIVDGDALMSDQLAGTHSEKVADFAAAKTARDARK